MLINEKFLRPVRETGPERLTHTTYKLILSVRSPCCSYNNDFSHTDDLFRPEREERPLSVNGEGRTSGGNRYVDHDPAPRPWEESHHRCNLRGHT